MRLRANVVALGGVLGETFLAERFTQQVIWRVYFLAGALFALELLGRFCVYEYRY